MSILKLKPSFKDYLWGGHRLVEEYGKKFDGDILAESWELSCHPDGPSTIVNGAYAGITLDEYIEIKGRSVLGTHCKRFKEFPILIKFIDAKQDLSIQVHPDNRYALKNEGQYGKTEMWYIMDAAQDAFLYYGFKNGISKEEFEQRIQNNTLLEVLNAVPVQKGDVLFIECGTIHAIGKNVLIAEIQQNSNLTYRVYDYGRVGKDGKKRDLHIEKALAVTNCIPIVKSNSSYPHVADCDYFTVDKLNLDGKTMRHMGGYVSRESFVSILILDGDGTISCGGETVSYCKGDSFFISAGSGSYVIEGDCDALVTTVRDKDAPIRIGININSRNTNIGLVDVNNKLLDEVVIPTLIDCNSEEMLSQVGQKTVELLEKNQITMDQCVGVGIGVPGTVDRKKGTVLYSNNILWENVHVAKELEKYFPVPIFVANNADCAALGEAIEGAGKECSDVVMITLGTGVGGGIIMNGAIYESKGISGSELGHMVIVEDGELCTCGRRGCLEAYTSEFALIRKAQKIDGMKRNPEEIFEAANAGDVLMKEIVDTYIRRLGTGIVNIVNVFRPQIVILGGDIPKQGEVVLAPLREIMKKDCFGGVKSDIPYLEAAILGNKAAIIGAANLV